MHRCIYVGVIFALGATSLGCNQLKSDPVTLIKDVRLIAVRADPPFIAGPGLKSIAPGTPTKLVPLLVSHKPLPKLCFAWRLCAYAWLKDGNYRCVDPRLEVDLGTDEGATLSMFDVLKSLEHFEAVAETIGLNLGPPSGGPDAGAADGGSSGQPSVQSTLGLEVSVLFMIGKPSVWGGACPATSKAMLDKVCPTRDGCVQGYTKLALVTREQQVNRAPEVTKWLMNGVDWPAALTPTLAPVPGATGNQPGPDLDGNEKTDGVELDLKFAASDVEVIKPAKGAQPEVTESLTFSWFTDNGRFRYSKTTHLFPKTRWSALAPGEDNEDEAGLAAVNATIWMVARDNRNGLSWQSRNVVVKVGHKPKLHPLCDLDPTLDGCADIGKADAVGEVGK